MSMLVETAKIIEELSELRGVIQSLEAKIEQLMERDEAQLPTEHPHVICSPRMHQGEPTVRGTAITVRTIVERARLGETPEQIVEAYPVLTMGQVYDALGYYYDHSTEIESYIQENTQALWRLTKTAST
jgi:uncharacterized protein (DUF433 family)